MAHPKPTLEEWQDAIWSYLLEHSDIMDSGALFVKFHTDNRLKFEKRIWARYKGYHRTDPRIREEHMNRQQSIHISERQTKKEGYRNGQMQRRFSKLSLAEMSHELLREVIYRALLRSHGKVVELRWKRTPEGRTAQPIRHTHEASTPPPSPERR